MLKKDAVVLDAEGIRTDTVGHAIADFNMQRKMRPSLGQAVGHISLNWSPEDSAMLTDEIMVNVAKEYLARMKIRDTQVLLVRHHDADHDHLHIIYNRVDNQGNTIGDGNQRWQNVRASRALTVKHGFHIAKGKDKVNRQQLKGGDRTKYQIHDQLKALLLQATSIQELEKLLAAQGIGVQYKYKSGTTEVQGISFSKGQYLFKGSEIDRSLSYGKISKQLSDNALNLQEQQKKGESKGVNMQEEVAESQSKALRSMVEDVPEPLLDLAGDLLQGFLRSPVSYDSDDAMIYRKRRKRGRSR